MAISNKEFQQEAEKLFNIENWLDKQIIDKSESDKQLKNRIAELQKQSKGKYNEELETTKKLYEITHKSFEKYSEAKEQPYFARIDFREYRREKESYYIGKFGLDNNITGDEVVIDWRAPIADLYYSGTQGAASYEAPMGFIDGELFLKRKFLIRNEKLMDSFDEGINDIIIKSGLDSAEGSDLIDEFLKINLEESVSSRLKDVVATIQKEQNDIIRANKNTAVIVQGSAGSGKTTVALHRLAYLLYKHKKTLKGEDVLVIAPNKVFLDYISEVLPSLGVNKVQQKTFEEIATNILGIKRKIYTKDKKLADILEDTCSEDVKYVEGSSKLKGSLLFKTIIDRYLRYLEIEDMKVEDITVEKYVMYTKEEIKRLFSKDMAHLPLDRRKEEIKRYFMLKFAEKVTAIVDKVAFNYEYSVARLKKTMEDGEERRKKIIELYDERDNRKKEIKTQAKIALEDYFNKWKHSDVKQLLINFFEDEEIFEKLTENSIPKNLAKYIIKEFKSNEEKNIIDSDDLTIMLYLKLNIEGVTEKYKFKHVVIDEAQDYSIFQYAAMQYIAVNNSFTIVGDIGQGIYYYKGINDWNKLIKDIFNENAEYVPLTQSYRSTVEIIELANKVLNKQDNNIIPAKPVLRHGKKPEIIEFKENKEFALRIEEIIKEIEAIGKNSIAIIGRTYEECKHIKEILKKYSEHKWTLIKDTDKTVHLDKIVIPSYMTKGLEFDCSVIYNCNEENYKDSELDKKILYVALTRALHLQYVFYSGEKSILI